MADATLAFNILTKYRDAGADKAARDLDRLSTSGSRTASMFKKVGAAAAVGLAGGVVLASRALFDGVKSAVADEAAQKRLATAYRNNANATDGQIAASERWITAQGKAYGVADEDLRPALGRLVTATHDVGKAQQLASLAMDVSAGTGKSLKSVTEALMKAQNGQVSGLSRLGIQTKNAKGETLTFEQATKKMSETFGGQAAKNADTLEGKMARLKVAWDEGKEAVGAKLIPVLSSLATIVIDKVLPSIGQTITQMRNGEGAVGVLGSAVRVVGEVAVSTAKFLNDHRVVIVAIIGAYVAWKTATLAMNVVAAVQLTLLKAQTAGTIQHAVVSKTVAAATKTWAAVQWLLNAALTANPIGIVVVAIAGLVVGLVIAYKKSETFRKIVNAALNAVVKVAQTVFGWVKDHWPLLLAIMTGPIGIAVLLIIKNFDKLKAGFGKVVDVAKVMGRGIKAAWDFIQNATRTAILWLVDKVLWMAEKVLDTAVSAFGWAPGIGDKLKAARDQVTRFREGVNAEMDKIRDENVTVTVQGLTRVASNLASVHSQNTFADGGPVRGGVPGKDSVLAALMPGEHVFTAEEVRRGGGHDAMKAIRRMLRRGEFSRHGDVPAFATGGPVFSASTPSTAGLHAPFQKLADAARAKLTKRMQAYMREVLKKLGGEGKLTPAQIARGQAFARSQVGDPYVWGGVGPNGFDCSGFVGAVLNAAQGHNPYSRRGTTSSMPWAGFSQGKGSFSVGWFTGSPGHMAGSIGGMGIESAGGVGVRIGGAATSVSSFPHVAHFDKGGWLQPGWTAAYNGTGRPERVITGGGGGRSDVLGVVEVVVRNEDGREIQRKLLELKRKTGATLGLS